MIAWLLMCDFRFSYTKIPGKIELNLQGSKSNAQAIHSAMLNGGLSSKHNERNRFYRVLICAGKCSHYMFVAAKHHNQMNDEFRNHRSLRLERLTIEPILHASMKSTRPRSERRRHTSIRFCEVQRRTKWKVL